MKKNNVLSEVIDLSLPVIGEMVVYNFMNIFDAMMIGNFGGNKAVSAVTLSTEIVNTSFNIIIYIGLAISITSLVARSIGARSIKEAQLYSYTGIRIGFLLAILMFVILFNFSKEILSLFKAKDEVLYYANIYIKVISIALVPNILITIINAILRGIGNTVIPFKISLIVALNKIFFDFIFIFGIGTKSLGIIGSAIATVISQTIGFIVVFFYILKKYFLKFNIKYLVKSNFFAIKQVLKLSIPSCLEEGAYGITRLFCTGMIMSLGSISFASNEIANIIEGISVMPGVGISVAATALVGMRAGEKDYKMAKKYANYCCLLAVGMMMTFSVFFVIMPDFLADLFVKDNERQLIKLTALCLSIGALEQPFIAISNVFSGALKGLGDAKTPLYISLFTGICIRLPLIYIFIYKLRWSVINVWWITTVQWAFDGILMYIIFNRKCTKRIKNLE
ncbi:MATE family efflux transporter [Clostridium rectalis]|uniref:MATE family efflux transporter n=1 Tax=Clostridium rectalis TaxID=2040295 RepID=UPI000F63A70E|nr:MATE family efflux transporter [Clostridium rectalis]